MILPCSQSGSVCDFTTGGVPQREAGSSAAAAGKPASAAGQGGGVRAHLGVHGPGHGGEVQAGRLGAPQGTEWTAPEGVLGRVWPEEFCVERFVER